MIAQLNEIIPPLATPISDSAGGSTRPWKLARNVGDFGKRICTTLFLIFFYILAIANFIFRFYTVYFMFHLIIFITYSIYNSVGVFHSLISLHFILFFSLYFMQKTVEIYQLPDSPPPPSPPSPLSLLPSPLLVSPSPPPLPLIPKLPEVISIRPTSPVRTKSIITKRSIPPTRTPPPNQTCSQSAAVSVFQAITVTDEEIQLDLSAPLSFKGWPVGYINYQGNVERFLAYSSGQVYSNTRQENVQKALKKYWALRYNLFSKFTRGILLDEESFYSACPEVLSVHIARRCHGKTAIDPFCGAGGNIIQLAKTRKNCIAMDIDANKIFMAKNNAQVYGVQNKIKFETRDFFETVDRPKADVLYMSPPWGGPDYLNIDVFKLSHMFRSQGGGQRLLQIAREISPKVAIHLPRNIDIKECVAIAEYLNFERIKIEKNIIQGKLNSITIFLS